jgi:nucleotide-binding universal stress UspA family protein
MAVSHAHPLLLCFDRSAGARRAIETAGSLFPGREAVLLHVWAPIAVLIGPYAAMLPPDEQGDAMLQVAALETAGEGVELAVGAGLVATPEAVPASFHGTWHEILLAADRHECALIVLGARGLSPLRSMVLGSVSHGVAQHAHRPVLIVPPTAVERPIRAANAGEGTETC